MTRTERNKIKRRNYLKIMIALVSVAGVVTAAVLISEPRVRESTLMIEAAESGTLESSIPASGKIVPLYEEAIVSPVATRILEVYCEEGDRVEKGQSLLKLDLQTAETEMRRLADEVSISDIAAEQTALNNDTYLTDLQMKINTKAMTVDHLKAEVANEKRLDSIGSGTGDRVREAELAYRSAKLELEQLKTQLVNERKAYSASYRSKKLEATISRRNLEEMERTLDNAKIKSPKGGTVTYLNKNIGTSIGEGERLAVVSDLTHFKIKAEIPEGNASKLSVGSLVKVRFNRHTLTGHISSISPQSKNGIIEFSVLLDDDSYKGLRSGLRAELNVVFDEHDNIVRIPNGQYFQGPGEYNLFVKTSYNKLERRKVSLGDSNFDYVEVLEGLKPGEKVVVSDMSEYANRKGIKLK